MWLASLFLSLATPSPCREICIRHGEKGDCAVKCSSRSKFLDFLEKFRPVLLNLIYNNGWIPGMFKVFGKIIAPMPTVCGSQPIKSWSFLVIMIMISVSLCMCTCILSTLDTYSDSSYPIVYKQSQGGTQVRSTVSGSPSTSPNQLNNQQKIQLGSPSTSPNQLNNQQKIQLTAAESCWLADLEGLPPIGPIFWVHLILLILFLPKFGSSPAHPQL